jgi:hypothetical protein
MTVTIPRRNDVHFPFDRPALRYMIEEAETAIPAYDKERTRERYLKAVSLLEDVLKGRNEKWGNFEPRRRARQRESD